ncbi:MULTISPECIES: hypothetical protein [unclassified Lysinibacillus]|uniref:hypothetical protein n=1 Tax=unclassified Lysinibacillus TaxID=2636778 RepID=UPI0038284678
MIECKDKFKGLEQEAKALGAIASKSAMCVASALNMIANRVEEGKQRKKQRKKHRFF